MENGGNRVKLAALFFKRAEADLKSAQALLSTENYADSVYHAQQAGEKSAKAILVLENMFVRDHLVSPILLKAVKGRGEEIQERVATIIKILRKLETHWVRPRYPFISEKVLWDPVKEYGRKDAEEVLKGAKDVVSKVRDMMKEVYGIVV